MTRYIIELEPGVWRADWTNGDPPRTCDRRCARQYATERAANIGLAWCRKYRPFKNARIEQMETKGGGA